MVYVDNHVSTYYQEGRTVSIKLICIYTDRSITVNL